MSDDLQTIATLVGSLSDDALRAFYIWMFLRYGLEFILVLTLFFGGYKLGHRLIDKMTED